MAHHETGVGHQGAVQPIEEVGSRRPVPRHTLLQALERHALDASEHAHEVLGVVASSLTVGKRGDAEPAVASDHGRDTVRRGWAERRVPERLSVVVGVQVDESGSNDEIFGVDRAGCDAVELPDGHDAAVAHTHVGAAARAGGAINDGAAGDGQIEHLLCTLHRRDRPPCRFLPGRASVRAVLAPVNRPVGRNYFDRA